MIDRWAMQELENLDMREPVGRDLPVLHQRWAAEVVSLDQGEALGDRDRLGQKTARKSRLCADALEERPNGHVLLRAR